MAHEEHLVDLEDLGHERILRLQITLGHDALDGVEQNLVVRGRQLCAWEQVGGNAVEKRHIVREELGQVDVPNGPQHEDGLGVVRHCALEVAGRSEHRLDGAHSVVVVVLR